MTEILYYGVKLVLTSGVLFFYYQLFLRDKTFHHYNRFYILGSVVVSLLLPLLKANYFTVQVNNENYLLLNQLQKVAAMNDHVLSYPDIFALCFAFIAVLLTGRFLNGIFKILKFKKRFSKEAFEGVDLYMTDLEEAPFSYFKNLFWKHTIPIDSSLGRQILEHEMVHIKQRHTYDKIFMEIARSVFWFNPFFYMMRKEIHLIHEYLADKKAVEHSDTRVFAQMLLASHFSAKALPATSPLLSAHLKKRLTMLKTATTKFSYARKVLVLPLLSIVVFVSVVHIQNTQAQAIHFDTMQAGDRSEKSTATAEPFIAIHMNKIRESTTLVLQQDNEETLKDSQQDTGRTAVAGREKAYMVREHEAMTAHHEAMAAQREAMVARQGAMEIKQEAIIVAQQAAIIRQQAEQIKEFTKNL